MRALLGYIYTGIINRQLVETNAQELFAIADKYEISGMKHYFETYLASTITTE